MAWGDEGDFQERKNRTQIGVGAVIAMKMMTEIIINTYVM